MAFTGIVVKSLGREKDEDHDGDTVLSMTISPTSAELAEQSIRAGEAMPDEPLASTEMERLVHEIRVHEIELETQNEELRRSKSELESFLNTVLRPIRSCSSGLFTLSDNGVILEANVTGASLLGRGQTWACSISRCHITSYLKTKTSSTGIADNSSQRTRPKCASCES